MIQLVPPSFRPSIFTARLDARTRMRDFFGSHIANPNTRRAYMEAVGNSPPYVGEIGILDLADVAPVHVARFVELQLKTVSWSALRAIPAAKTRRIPFM